MTEAKVTIHWKIDKTTGHGPPIKATAAEAWVKKLNRLHGESTHWTEPVEQP